jgi:LPS O-antigen subunit length determinant protein (WzzB/FepE family)
MRYVTTDRAQVAVKQVEVQALHSYLTEKSPDVQVLENVPNARLDESKDAAVIQVLETASAPDRRSSPHRVMIVLLFPMFGAVGACAFVLLTYYFIQNNADLPESLAELRAALANKQVPLVANESVHEE